MTLFRQTPTHSALMEDAPTMTLGNHGFSATARNCCCACGNRPVRRQMPRTSSRKRSCGFGGTNDIYPVSRWRSWSPRCGARRSIWPGARSDARRASNGPTAAARTLRRSSRFRWKAMIGVRSSRRHSGNCPMNSARCSCSRSGVTSRSIRSRSNSTFRPTPRHRVIVTRSPPCVVN